jgi:hypothetical protein
MSILRRLIVTSHIKVKFTLLVYNMSGNKVSRLYSPKNNWYVICDKKKPPWFVIWYDFYPTRYVFPIPSPRLGDRKHKTRWMKTISNKPWEIFYIYLLYGRYWDFDISYEGTFLLGLQWYAKCLTVWYVSRYRPYGTICITIRT